MKQIFFLFLMASLLSSRGAQSQHLIVIIKNIRDNKGKVGAALFNNEKDFLKKNIGTRSARAVVGEVRLVFDRIPTGDYAISILHDLNDNGDIDTDFLGIPKEGFGFSNDVMGAFGPPKFEKAKFTFAGKDQEIVIKMKYF
jgi:uncharacterized protein (DUF2141 family)